jgi:hypothetical protein
MLGATENPGLYDSDEALKKGGRQVRQVRPV